MTDLPICPLCPDDRRRPLYDNAYVCRGCAEDVGRHLGRLEAAAGQAWVTVSRQSRSGPGGRRTSPEWPLPVNLGSGSRYDAAVNELLTRARRVAEERGHTLPWVRTGWCGHASCAQRRRGLVYGPRCPDGAREHPIVVLAGWLTSQLEWLRHHPDGQVALRDIRASCRSLERVIDRSPDRWYAGPCGEDGCEEELNPVSGAKTIRCGACGAEHDPEARRAWLLREAEDQLAIAAWCAAMLTLLGIHTPAANIRKWAERGRLLSHGTDLQDRPLYRLGDVRDLAIEAAHHRAARQAKEAADEARRRASLTTDHVGVTLGAQADSVCPQPA